MDLLDMESTINKNRINYTNRVAKTKKYILGKITKSTHKGSWKEVTYKISDDKGINNGGQRLQNAHNQEKKMKNKFQEKLKGAGNKKSKV